MIFDITLTFDNGPEPGMTDVVLETLEQDELRASFFRLGGKLVCRPASYANPAHFH